MTASDVASLHEFPDVCEVIHLMDPSTAAASQDNLIDQVSLQRYCDIRCNKYTQDYDHV